MKKKIANFLLLHFLLHSEFFLQNAYKYFLKQELKRFKFRCFDPEPSKLGSLIRIRNPIRG